MQSVFLITKGESKRKISKLSNLGLGTPKLLLVVIVCLSQVLDTINLIRDNRNIHPTKHNSSSSYKYYVSL